ncbi:MAG: TonB-dependent siderophore receptor [Methylobacter sp.]|nr:TonB-dependent siderophore receptor [Methylobacter sp.]
MKYYTKRPLMMAIAALINAPYIEAAEITNKTLPEVKVKAAVEKEPAYKADTSSTGLKFEAPIRDIPQSVSVVKEELIKSQNAFNLRDALKNVSGLTIAAGEGGRTGDSITLRGFAANSDTYMDGAKENGQYFRDTFFIDRAEVLKGASSVLFGRGSTGGVINTIAKKPLKTTHAQADFTYGNYDFKRTTVDAGTAINDQVSVRLNALYQDADSYRDYNYNDRWGIAPSVKLDITPDTDLTLLLLHQEEKSVFDYGVPMIGGKPANVPVNQFYGFKDDLLQTFDTSIVTAIFNHRFNSDFAVRNTSRYGNYDREYRTLLFTGAPRGTGAAATVRRTQALRESPQENYYNQTDFTFKKPILGFNNTLLFGAEIGWENFTFRSKNSVIPNSVADISIYNPISSPTSGLRRANDLATDRITRTNSIAGYVLDQFEITPQWKLLAGGRYNIFQAKQDDHLLNANDFERTDHQWSRRAGLVWQPKDWQAYYFSYGTSFNPSAETFALAANTANLKPEQNQNLEVGAKVDLFDGRLSATGALFRLEKTNARTTDPNDSTLTILAGEQKTDGFEFGLAGDILPDWSLSATYAYLDAEVTKSTTFATGLVSGQSQPLQGKRSVNVPQNSGVVWTSYHITPEWEIGGGVFMASSRFTDAVNEVSLPGYARLDATVAYHQKHYDIQINAFNLLDKVYYESGQNNTALPATPLSGQVTVRVKY